MDQWMPASRQYSETLAQIDVTRTGVVPFCAGVTTLEALAFRQQISHMAGMLHRAWMTHTWTCAHGR